MIAPHVGVDSSGIIGQVHRRGQNESSPACGAAIGAYKSVKTDPDIVDF